MMVVVVAVFCGMMMTGSVVKVLPLVVVDIDGGGNKALSGFERP